ncbi:MAG: helix-turn-helix domain-containing protein [Acidobacteriota bacterium]
MKTKRTFSTRELAQMWNVSESTIKRWADSGNLRCYRTPGGHRKFQLENISDFQQRQGFEATGFLTTEQWEEPEIEESLNRKRFEKVCDLIYYLATQNQRKRVKDLLERLYIRGMGIVDLYDEVLVPVVQAGEKALARGELSLGQERLLKNNLEEALSLLFPQLICRRKSGKTGLCAAPDGFGELPVNAIARILETEGWDCLNLGGNIPFAAMAEMVEQEPVNLVCVVCSDPQYLAQESFSTLTKAAGSYRIPVVLTGVGFSDLLVRESFPHDEYFPDFLSFRTYVSHLSP